jgi:hypothetical protein
MTRRQTAIRVLCIAAILATTLPVLAAAKRNKPMGLSRYTLVYSNSFQGETETGRERGLLAVSRRRIIGRSNNGNSIFNLRIINRLTRAARQNTQAKGKIKINHPDAGLNSGRINANIRIQKTRRGIWKTSGNYTGVITRGRARGATLSGRFVAKSI